MVLGVQNQKPQQLRVHVAGVYTAKGGGEKHHVVAVRSLPPPPPLSATHRTRRAFSPPTLEKVSWFIDKIYHSRTEEKELTILEGETTMSRRNGPKLDLKLNLSPPRVNHPRVQSPSRSLTVSPTSPQSSCVSSELNQQDEYLRYSTSPEATSMMLVGCPRCLMYVMLAEDDPRCPKCKSSVLLDVIHDNNTTTTTTSRKAKKS